MLDLHNDRPAAQCQNRHFHSRQRSANGSSQLAPCSKARRLSEWWVRSCQSRLQGLNWHKCIDWHQSWDWIDWIRLPKSVEAFLSRGLQGWSQGCCWRHNYSIRTLGEAGLEIRSLSYLYEQVNLEPITFVISPKGSLDNHLPLTGS